MENNIQNTDNMQYFSDTTYNVLPNIIKVTYYYLF